VPKDFYAAAIRALKARGWIVALDASGEALRLGVEAGPDVIKPNADECEALVGFVPKTPEDFRRATEALRAHAAHVIISDGGAGAWFDGEFVAAPEVKVLDTTSAGDTLLAEYCWRGFADAQERVPPVSAEQGGSRSRVTEAARWAVAAGSAAVTMPGSMPPPVELVEKLKENIK
jgi:fructose-1-phosphate kinase PfkB-like protein